MHNKTKHKNSKKRLPPLYTAPELLRAIALALGTKEMDRTVGKTMDEYVRKGQYIHDSHCELLKYGIIEPISRLLAPKTKEYLAIMLEYLTKRYHEVVLQFPCNDRNRSETHSDITLLFSPIVMDSLQQLTESLHLPAPETIIQWDNPIKSAIDWLEGNCPDSTKAISKFAEEKNATDYVCRWRKGNTTPSTKSLMEFTEFMPSEQRERAFAILLFSRACAFTYSKHKSLRDKIVYLYSSERQGIDPDRIGVKHNFGSFAYRQLTESLSAYNSLLQDEYMTTGTKRKIQDALREADQYHRNAGLPLSCKWPLSLVSARTAVADGQLQQALAAYKQAFDEGLYSVGNTQIDIIDEALCVAAMQRDVRFLERLKNQAIAFGMMEPPTERSNDPSVAYSGRRKNDFVEDWEIARWRQRFHEIFPANCRFVDATHGIDAPETPIITIDPDKHAEPDLKHPDRIVQLHSAGGSYRLPQLHWFASINDLDSVKKLITNGADFISPWKDDGNSVFHTSIRLMSMTGPRAKQDDSLFRLMVAKIEEQGAASDKREQIKKMMQTTLVKTHCTVLGNAIETARPHVVSKVLALGAPVDQRHTTGHITPLYYLCQLIHFQSNPDEWLRQMRHAKSHMSPDQIDDLTRRYGIPFSFEPTSERHIKIIEETLQSGRKQLKSLDRAALIEIARILLENGADANAPHTINRVQRRTPLMLAVESNDLELFDLLIDFGGDISQTCFSTLDHREYTCQDIAARFGAQVVLDQLRAMTKPQ